MKLTCPYLSQFPFLKHGFFQPSALKDKENIVLEGHSLPLVTLQQIHGDKVVQVQEPFSIKQEGDGLVTRAKGIALGIFTADCGPVLFCDPVAQVIGACHAGWRGAQKGILQATLKAMEGEGGCRSRIHATLGPTIQQENYEVGPEFPDLINAPYEAYFRPSEKVGYHFFNLPAYICQQLSCEGVAHVHDLAQDTFTSDFASRRRHLSEGITEKKDDNLSLVAII